MGDGEPDAAAEGGPRGLRDDRRVLPGASRRIRRIPPWGGCLMAQLVIPMLAYEDGRLTHGELDTGGGVVMLATPSLNYRGPKRHREECEIAQGWHDVPYIIDGVLVYVDDIDAHFERAQAAGATILSPLEEGGEGKRYRAEDLEGHRWMFI